MSTGNETPPSDSSIASSSTCRPVAAERTVRRLCPTRTPYGGGVDTASRSKVGACRLRQSHDPSRSRLQRHRCHRTTSRFVCVGAVDVFRDEGHAPRNLVTRLFLRLVHTRPVERPGRELPQLSWFPPAQRTRRRTESDLRSLAVCIEYLAASTANNERFGARAGTSTSKTTSQSRVTTSNVRAGRSARF